MLQNQGLFGQMLIQDSGIHRDFGTSNTSCKAINAPRLNSPIGATITTTTTITKNNNKNNNSSTTDIASADLSGPYCHHTFTSHIGLINHLRIHRPEIGEPVPGAPIYSRLLLPWLGKRKSSRPFVNNHRGRCSVSQPSSPTLPVTPPVSLLGSLAHVALLPGEETGVGPRPDDQKDPKPAAPSLPLTQAQNPFTVSTTLFRIQLFHA
ncbi:unnamed protein product [Schistocephalus solidus]|uniref:C2H2-type domain-containing protein n=1 Tax=Schistocephalus solidus TaxID=70667 RepID=A0A183SRG0_SCHSO|nr:unnamed protein product [Schistocephalus solidus]